MRLSIYIALFCCLPLNSWASMERVDSLRQIYLAEKTSSYERIDLAFMLAEQYRNLSDFDSALHYAQQGYQIAEVNGENRKIQFYDLVGQIHFRTQRFLLANRFFRQGESLAKETHEPLKQAHLINSLGNTHAIFDDYPTALTCFYTALGIFESENKSKRVIITKKNIALAYLKLGQPNKALTILEELYQLSIGLGHIRNACKTLLMMAKSQIDMGEFEAAEKHLATALELAQSDQLIEIVRVHLVAGNSLAKQGEFRESILRLEKALEAAWEQAPQSINLQADIYLSMGHTFLLAGNYSEARSRFEQSLSLRDSSHYLKRKGLHEYLAQVSRAEKKFAQADSFIQIAAQLGDEIYRQEQLQRSHELEDNEAFDRFLAQTQDLKNRAYWQNMLLIGVGIAMTGLLLIVLFLYHKFRITQKGNAFLTQQHESILGLNTQLTEQQKHIQTQNEQLLRSNTSLEKYVTAVSHDLRSPILTIGSFVEFMKKQSDRLPKDFQTALNFILTEAQRMEQLLEDLLILGRIGGSEVPPQPVDLNQTLAEIRQSLTHQIQTSGATLNIGNLPTLLGHPAEIRQLFQNLISNAIKFHKPGVPPIVSISAKQQGDTWEISVQDNGIGFNPEHQQKAFKLFGRLNSGDEYSGTGIGLSICLKVVEHLGWEMGVESKEGDGARFWIRVQKKHEV